MITKAFEIRDSGTFIAALAISMEPSTPEAVLGRLVGPEIESAMAEAFLFRHTGYAPDDRLIMLVRMDANGKPGQASYDPYSWGSDARTMPVAHKFIAEHWDALNSGAVIDVEFILGFTTKPKASERYDYSK